jgi:hypothetical protein
MKFHWGKGIIIVFVLFAAGIALMVTVSMRQKVDLVTDDYYDRELKHQEQIDRSTRSAAMGDSLRIVTSASELTIRFPASYLHRTVSGTVSFYRPSDRRLDVVIPVLLDGTASQILPLSSLQQGVWKMKLEWTVDDISYYREEPIVVQ